MNTNLTFGGLSSILRSSILSLSIVIAALSAHAQAPDPKSVPVIDGNIGP